MIRVNLLQIREEVRRAGVRNYFIISGVVVLVALLIAYSWHSGIVSEIETTKAQITRAQAEIRKLDKVIGEVEKIKKQKANLEEKLETIQRLELDRKYLVELFNELGRILPNDTWITEVNIEQDEIEIKGSSVDNQLIGEFLGALNRSKMFDSLIYGPSKQKEIKGGIRYFDFSVEARTQDLNAENFVTEQELEAAQP